MRTCHVVVSLRLYSVVSQVLKCDPFVQAAYQYQPHSSDVRFRMMLRDFVKQQLRVAVSVEGAEGKPIILPPLTSVRTLAATPN